MEDDGRVDLKFVPCPIVSSFIFDIAGIVGYHYYRLTAKYFS